MKISSSLFACLLLGCIGLPVDGQLLSLDEGFETVINLDPPADDGQILATGWQGALRSTPQGFTGVFQGVPPDGMGGGAAFAAHLGPDNSYMGVAFTSAGSFGPEDVISTWMMSPTLEIENGDVFSFYTRTASFSVFPDRLNIRLSTNGDSTDVGTSSFSLGDFTTLLTSVNPNLEMAVYPDEWTKFEVEFTGFAEPFVGRIAFHYFVENLFLNANSVGIDTVTFGKIGGGDCLLGDVNQDGEVNLLDVGPFVDAISMGNFLCEGDINLDNAVDLLDVGPFVDILSGG